MPSTTVFETVVQKEITSSSGLLLRFSRAVPRSVRNFVVYGPHDFGRAYTQIPRLNGPLSSVVGLFRERMVNFVQYRIVNRITGLDILQLAADYNGKLTFPVQLDTIIGTTPNYVERSGK